MDTDWVDVLPVKNGDPVSYVSLPEVLILFVSYGHNYPPRHRRGM